MPKEAMMRVEWGSAFRLAIGLFVTFLVAAPIVAPDHQKFAAEINHRTLKAAAAIKNFKR